MKFSVIDQTFVFLGNIPHDFIEVIWADSPHMAEHLRAKFNGCCYAEGYASANAIFRFYCSLDEYNSEKFCSYASNWIRDRH